MTSNTNNIQELQSILDDQKENLSDGSYLSICALTQKIMDKSKNSFYEIEYLETYISKKNPDLYGIEFKNYKSYLQLTDIVLNNIAEQIEKNGFSKICQHVLNESFEMIKINKQELYGTGYCDECSDPCESEIVIKNGILILKVTKC